uniref:Uncharacterized protein n=1 Tax=Rhizophora mucronata TaxID=61149 RepID=A0A2P2NSP0_RHIMU
MLYFCSRLSNCFLPFGFPAHWS